MQQWINGGLYSLVCAPRAVLALGNQDQPRICPVASAKPPAIYCSFLCPTHRVNEKLHLLQGDLHVTQHVRHGKPQTYLHRSSQSHNFQKEAEALQQNVQCIIEKC